MHFITLASIKYLYIHTYANHFNNKMFGDAAAISSLAFVNADLGTSPATARRWRVAGPAGPRGVEKNILCAVVYKMRNNFLRIII